MNALLRKNILDSTLYVPGRSKFDLSISGKKGEKIQLSSNTNILGASPKVQEAIKSSIKNIQNYPDPTADVLKTKLAKLNELDRANFLIGNGSAEIIDLINHSFIEPGDEMLTSIPTFQKYHISAKICNANLKTVKLKNSHHDLDGIIEKISEKTKVIYIDTPNNPVGTAVSRNKLDKFLKKIPDHVICVIDEAYHEFNKIKNHLYYKKYIGRKNIVFLRSFSKAFGIAGLRIGYMIGHSEIIANVNRVREVFNVNILALEAASAALEDLEHVEQNSILTNSEKIRLYKNLDQLKFKYYKSEGNFIFINTERELETVDKFLLDRGIIVRPIELKDTNDGHIRVTIGLPDENKYFINVLAELQNKIPKLN